MTESKSEPLVYIVDDDISVRDSLRLLIESTGRIVKCFDSAISFLNNYNHEQPGCLILDIWMPGMTGLEMQQELEKRRVAIPIIFISGLTTIPVASMAFRAGAVDFFEKPLDCELLLIRIEEEIQKFSGSYDEKRKFTLLLDTLTPKEKEVYKLVVKGLSNKEIAKALGNNHRTLESYRAKIMKKLQVKNLHEMIALTARFGEIDEKQQG